MGKKYIYDFPLNVNPQSSGYTIYEDGVTTYKTPINAFGNQFLPLTGGSLSGNLSVRGNYSSISGSLDSATTPTTITSGSSITCYDTSATTVTGGTYIYNVSVGSGGNHTVDLTPYDLYIAPGEVATFSIQAQASSTVAVSVNWSEDI